MNTTAKSFDIAETLWERDGATLAEPKADLEIPESTIHRHLASYGTAGTSTRWTASTS